MAHRSYQVRMQRVLDHIDRHLDDDLDLDTLSSVAAFSKYHFHRQFTATFGLSVRRYIQLARMKRASYRLAYRSQHSVTGIAMEAGYETPEGFARAFRQRLGQVPSSFRKEPDCASWHTAFAPLDDARNRLRPTPYAPSDVTIRFVAPTPVAIMEHRGDPATIRRFIAWRQRNALTPKTSPTFTVFHSDPISTPSHEYRLDLCAGTDRPIEPDDTQVTAGTIGGGRCAVLRVVADLFLPLV